MSGAGTRLSALPEPSLPKGRSPLAHLLHALNQPVTGLQCSLELAVAGPRRSEHYLRALRDGLQLTARIRLLVEAIRELAEAQPAEAGKTETVLLGALLAGIAAELLPVAEAKRVQVECRSRAPQAVLGHRGRLQALLFRLLESALTLAREGSVLEITADSGSGQAFAVISWLQGAAPEYSPFSRPELGLLIAQSAWEQSGGEWAHTQKGDTHVCTIRMPLQVGPLQAGPLQVGNRTPASAIEKLVSPGDRE